jgi:hypothetical protein
MLEQQLLGWDDVAESNHRWTPEKREWRESQDERRKKRRQASRGRRPLFFFAVVFLFYTFF